jgi:hypothetical protein
VAVVVMLCGTACSSSASPVSGPRTSTDPGEVDQAATYLGLTVRLQVGAPTAENGRTNLQAYFLVQNRTARAISYTGCPFGNLRFGLVPAAHPDAPLTGSSQTSCGGGTTSVTPGASDRYFAAMFPTRSTTMRLPDGDYIAVVRFADGTEVRKSVTVVSIELQVSPLTGGPLTVISIGGEGCVKPIRDRGPLDVLVNLTTTDRQSGLGAVHVPVRDGGSWTASLTVPATAVPGDYVVNAFCNRDGDIGLIEYESKPFTVIS